MGDLHEVQAVESDITKEKYDDLGLAVSPEASLREKAGIKLGIGYGNSKQFLKRLKMFGITYKELRGQLKMSNSMPIASPVRTQAIVNRYFMHAKRIWGKIS